MKKTYQILFMGLSLLGVVTVSQAADGNVQVNGEISTSTCEVDEAATNAAYGVIPFGSVRKNQFQSYINWNPNNPPMLKDSSPNPRKDFFISFKNCSIGSKYLISVSGKSGDSWNESFANDIIGGAAINLVVGYKPTGSDYISLLINNGSSKLLEVDNATESVPMRAALYRQYSSTITPGDFSFTVNYAVQFN